jgi:hypothetical protein
MATLAHRLGLHVHGHIPHGMRPLDAVRDGYDEITHIYFVMMQAMPDSVVKVSNTDARIAGTAKYAADVDLHSKVMRDYLDELARRHIAVDPTLVVPEGNLVPDPGTYAPAIAPYADTLPSQFARGYLQTGIATRPDLSRARMRASFAKLVELVGELDKRHITILAGTDGNGFEVPCSRSRTSPARSRRASSQNSHSSTAIRRRTSAIFARSNSSCATGR